MEFGVRNARRVKDNEEIRYVVEDCEFEPVLYAVSGEFNPDELEEAKKYCLNQARLTGNHHRVSDMTKKRGKQVLYHTKKI